MAQTRGEYERVAEAHAKAQLEAAGVAGQGARNAFRSGTPFTPVSEFPGRERSRRMT